MSGPLSFASDTAVDSVDIADLCLGLDKPTRSDLQVVSGNTAAHSLALVVKQLKALGIPYLHDLAGMRQCLSYTGFMSCVM